MKSLSHTVQKLKRMLKLTTDKQSNGEDKKYTPEIDPGIKIIICL